MLHNVSPVDGQGVVTILPRGSKGVGDTREKGRAIVEIPYATERQPDKIYGAIQSYESEPARDDKLHYGVAKISVPRAHKMGALEGYSILGFQFSNIERGIVLTDAVAINNAHDFGQLVRSRLNMSHEVLVYVHGFNTSFEDGLRRAAQIKYDLRFAGVVILYSWPSQGKINPFAYNQDSRNADLSSPHFKEFLAQLADAEEVGTVHVIAHSMGNRIVMSALAGQTNSSKLRHIALMAPDMDAVLFRRLVTSIKSPSGKVTLYASSKDGALIASRLYAGYTRAGQGGPDLIVLPGVLESVDASHVDTSLLGLNHSYFADNETILSDLDRLFRDVDSPSLMEETSAAGRFWILPHPIRAYEDLG